MSLWLSLDSSTYKIKDNNDNALNKPREVPTLEYNKQNITK
jgi:hypothetical protein